MNKRRIIKKSIIDNINNFNYIDRLNKSEILIMDDWSSNFYNNYKNYIDYQKNRDILLNRYKFSSTDILYLKDPLFKSLNSLSNIFINLNNKPCWLDVFLVISELKIKIDNKKLTYFENIVQICIEEIDKYYN